MAVAPIAFARRGASCVPPAIETCAPSRMSSFQTGATQLGSFALSLRGLNAGFLASCFLAAGRSLTVLVFLAADFFFVAALFFGFAADFRGRLRFELLRLAMECPPAARTVNRTSLVQGVVEGSAARALDFEGVAAAADAELIVGVVRAESSADVAAFSDAVGHGIKATVPR